MSFIDKIKDMVGVGDEYEEEEMDIVTRIIIKSHSIVIQITIIPLRAIR